MSVDLVMNLNKTWTKSTPINGGTNAIASHWIYQVQLSSSFQNKLYDFGNERNSLYHPLTSRFVMTPHPHPHLWWHHTRCTMHIATQLLRSSWAPTISLYFHQNIRPPNMVKIWNVDMTCRYVTIWQHDVMTPITWFLSLVVDKIYIDRWTFFVSLVILVRKLNAIHEKP